MIAKSCDVRDRDWDDQLPFLLFAYRASAQESTKESPFFLMHGRDPRIPTETVLTSTRSPYAADTDDYKVDLCSDLSTAWKLAKTNIEKAQVAQKSYYDKFSKTVDVKPGDRVMVFMPAERQGKAWKLSRPFHGPYRVLNVTNTNVEVRLVDSPQDESMFVHLNRVRKCNPQQGDAVWTGPSRKRKHKVKSVDAPQKDDSSQPYTGPTTRSRAKGGTESNC